jgi:hypothetical protein
MDCPNCGVYNPESRDVCWRCDKELPKPTPPKRREDPAVAMRRMWIVIGIAILLWAVLTWVVLPAITQGP